MKNRLLIVLFAFFLIFSPTLAQDYATSLDLGFRGIGLSVSRSFSPQFNARVGFAFFKIQVESTDNEGEDYSYVAEPQLTSFSVLADYFPFENLFRISGGLIVNLNAVDTRLTPTQSYTVGGDEYTPENLGDLNANISFPVVAPYLGLGIGNPTSGASGFSFSMDIGTFYQGAPQVDLSADGLLEPSAAPDQEQTLENNLNWFQWYPVLTLSVNYKF